ncbi:MAG: hypothetical protein KDB01_10480 [Planctomycetaceae bacterium]|nr:hypothetical protein [Planctomycetaceae bacterium]
MGSPYDVRPWNTSRSPSIFGDQFKLKLDPEIQAEIDRINFSLAFNRMQSLWYRPDWSVIDALLSRPEFILPQQLPTLPSAGGSPKSGNSAPLLAAPAGSSTPPKLTMPSPPNPTLRKGEASDVLKAVWKLPMVESAVNDLQKNLERQWNSLGTGEKATLITTSIIIGAGAVGGIASNEPTRVWFLEKISGVEIPVPKVDGLSFSILAPKGVIDGAGVQYENKVFNAKAAFEQTKMPDDTRFNNVTLTLNLNVVEAVKFLRGR